MIPISLAMIIKNCKFLNLTKETYSRFSRLCLSNTDGGLVPFTFCNQLSEIHVRLPV